MRPRPMQRRIPRTIRATRGTISRGTRFGAAEPPFVPRAPAPSFPRPTRELAVHPWGSTAAQMAYILFQTPVMVAVHASEMLENANA